MTGRLPIYDIEERAIEALAASRRLILQAPTGSGKSTQIPQILWRNGFLKNGQAIVLQPRRIAARLLASRVARECGTELGNQVGYQIRFDHVAGPETKIKYVTEGILLRQMIKDPQLRGVDALVLDEFHERNLYGDITLARALKIQEEANPELRLVVMSATLQADLLQNYLRPCEVLTSEGRTFPVEIKFEARADAATPVPVWEKAAEAFAGYVRSRQTGDVLVFMPGSYEINQTIRAISNLPESRDFILLPLHGELSTRDQNAAINRYDQRKVVVSTNVAETSLTIDGVQLVIDSGLARIPRYDPNRGINTLLVEKISRASADQRAGRAGRTAPGTCIRLWTRQEHMDRPQNELPEIKRLDLSEVVLTLKATGVSDLREFKWLEPPDEHSLIDAEQLLTDLGALELNRRTNAPIPTVPHQNRPDTAGSNLSDAAADELPRSQVTSLGRQMLAFPLHPRYSRMLLAAHDFGCVYQACLIAALTQGRDLLIRNPGRDTHRNREEILGGQTSSDFWFLVHAWKYAAENEYRIDACGRIGIHALTARQVSPLLTQFLRIARDEGLNTEAKSVPDQAIQKCILIGFSDRVARRLNQGTLRCELVHGRRGLLARASVVQKSPIFVASEIREVGGRDKSVNTLLSLATAIEIEWLRELFPRDMANQPNVFYDPAARRVYADEILMFRGLELERRRKEPPPLDAASLLLTQEVFAGRLTLTQWNHNVEQWILRVNLLCRRCPELSLPPVRDEDRLHLIRQICHGAFSYKEIKDRSVMNVVKSWLSTAQQQVLDAEAPERLRLSNGRAPKVVYVADGPPYIALRIQELYDVTVTPQIAMNRIPVLVHILAPNMRPVQITQDLDGFWREQYPRVKQELQRKYPKHPWR